MTIAEEQPRRWLHLWVWVLFDGAIWFIAICRATWLRFDFTNTGSAPMDDEIDRGTKVPRTALGTSR